MSRCPSTRRPTTDASSRPRRRATGCRRDELIVGAGADEILDIITKAFLPVGGAAVIPTPTYAMYRVDTEQRGATVLAVPRLRDAGWTLDLDATRTAARKADLVWLCSPNNPTAQAEPDGAIAGLLVGILRRTRSPTVDPRRSSSSTRPMPSSPAGRSSGSGRTTRTSS